VLLGLKLLLFLTGNLYTQRGTAIIASQKKSLLIRMTYYFFSNQVEDPYHEKHEIHRYTFKTLKRKFYLLKYSCNQRDSFGFFVYIFSCFLQINEVLNYRVSNNNCFSWQ
jgi:hypothetical protein